MNYSQCKDSLNRLGNEVLDMRPGLENVQGLLDRLGRPHADYPSVLVAGTNGKGSVSRFLASMIERCGLRTGRYSSPHLVSLRERISVDGRPISRSDFAAMFTRAARFVDRNRPLTYFEMLTVTAFLYFHRREVDVAVLEIGMGGRLDATNVVDPVLTVLTPIDLDHQRYLGESIEQIAFEKAGTIHRGRPVVSARQPKAAEQVIREQARRQEAPLTLVDEAAFRLQEQAGGCFRVRDDSMDATLKLPGRHQAENAILAVSAARQLRRPGWSLAPGCLAQGLRDATLMGRLHKIDSRPDVYLDGGHNPAAAVALRAFLEGATTAPRHLVFSAMGDKDIQSVARILQPLFVRQFVVPLVSPRAAGPSQLMDAFPAALQVADASDALLQARDGAATVVVFGSFYLVGEILRALPDPAC